MKTQFVFATTLEIMLNYQCSESSGTSQLKTKWPLLPLSISGISFLPWAIEDLRTAATKPYPPLKTSRWQRDRHLEKLSLCCLQHNHQCVCWKPPTIWKGNDGAIRISGDILQLTLLHRIDETFKFKYVCIFLLETEIQIPFFFFHDFLYLAKFEEYWS